MLRLFKEKESISVVAPTQTEYVLGEELATAGMVVTAHYDNGTEKERAVCDYVSSMTDRYAVAVFEEVYVPKSWAVL